MFSKLKEITRFRITSKEDLSSSIDALQEELSEGLQHAMEKTFSERQDDTKNSDYSPGDVDRIVESYANKNMVLAAAASIVPGPLGILSSIPVLLLNFSNQMSMIYDLGCATGKENFINKDVLLDIPLAAFGGNTNLSALQNNIHDLGDSSESVLLEKATVLGKSIVERTLKKSIVQFIPIAGPVLMGTWSKMATRKISGISITFLDDQQVYNEHFKPDENREIERQLQIEKIKGLANLIESNNEINENQIELIGTIIENSSLNDTEKELYLSESIKTGSEFTIDKSLLKQFEEEDDLIMEMVIMAKRSGQIDQQERQYIFQLGQELDVDEEFIKDLM